MRPSDTLEWMSYLKTSRSKAPGTRYWSTCLFWFHISSNQQRACTIYHKLENSKVQPWRSCQRSMHCRIHTLKRNPTSYQIYSRTGLAMRERSTCNTSSKSKGKPSIGSHKSILSSTLDSIRKGCPSRISSFGLGWPRRSSWDWILLACFDDCIA